MTSPLPVAVLISGAGSTLKNLIERQAGGELNTDIRLVISSHSAAGGLEIARESGIPTAVFQKSAEVSDEAYGQQVFGACREAGAELVVMAGFLKLAPVPDDYMGRVMNIHPALIPAFCGRGYYGSRVHRAVLEYGCKISGCTVHFVDNEYDHGPIILQRVVGVMENDTVESLAHRVQTVERDALPEAIELYAAGRLKLQGRKVIVDNAP